MSKAYYRVGEFQEELLNSRTKVFETGWDVGFHTAKDLISLKRGFTSFAFSAPYSGKSSWIADTYIHLAKKYGLFIALYSPEGGDKISVVSFLVQIYLGKKLHGSDAQTATEEDWLEAISFVQKHFLILDPKLVGKGAIRFTSDEIIKQITQAEKEYGLKVDLICIDPYNMISKSPEEMRMTIADFALENLSYWNQVARYMDIHVQICMHTISKQLTLDKDTGIEYMGRPHPSEVHNGMSVWRVAQQMMSIWRCPEGVIEKTTGIVYPSNASDFTVSKNKIFGAGKTGTFRLYYDTQSMKFYEMIGGRKYYCGEYEQQQNPTKSDSAIKPNLNFDSQDSIF